MAALADFFSRLYTVTSVFFTIFLLELMILFRAITRTVAATQNPAITTTQFFKFVEERNPTISYTRKLQMKPQPRDCAVCLSDFVEGEKIRKLKCNHTFHIDCLDRWLQQDYWATCPLCRTKVLPDEVVAGFHQLKQDPVEYDGSDEEIIFLLSALHGNSFHHRYF